MLWPSIAFGTVEDFFTYTESDSNNRITVTSSKITRILYSDTIGYVVKDFGADHFTTFTHYFNFIWENSYGSTYTSANCYILSDSSQPTNPNLDSANKGVSLLPRFYGSMNLRLMNYNGDSSDSTTDAQIISNGSTSYTTAIKTSTTFTVYFYSDSSRTVLEDSLSVSCTDNFRYLGAISDTDTGGYVSFSIENLDLEEITFTPQIIMY